MKYNKIAVIGGTGKAGKYLVQELLNQGFQIKLLIRNPEHLQIQNPLIEIINGNANDYSSIIQLLEDCDAVISTLGLGMPNSEKDIFSQSTKNVLKAMEVLNIDRYIVITGLNVDTAFDNKNPKTQFGTNWMKEHFPLTTADKQKEYSLLLESNINWTLVRLPLIEQTEQRNVVEVNCSDCSGDKISATDLAVFLVEQLSDKSFLKKAPFISNI